MSSSDAEVSSILRSQSQPQEPSSAFVRLKSPSQVTGEFEDGKFGRLKYGDNYYRFSVYRRDGSQRANMMPFIQNEQDWRDVAKAMCNLANDILKNNEVKNPDDIIPLLIKFHRIDGAPISANGDSSLTYDQEKFTILHETLQRVYSKFRPEDLPPPISRDSPSLQVDPSHSHAHSQRHTDSESEPEVATSGVSPRGRHTPPVIRQPIPRRPHGRDYSLSPSERGSPLSLSPRGRPSLSGRSTSSVNGLNLEIEVNPGLDSDRETACEYALADFHDLSERSRQLALTGNVQRCLSWFPRDIFYDFIKQKSQGVGKPNIIPVYYSSGKTPERVYWIALYNDVNSGQTQVFLPFQEGRIDLRQLYELNDDNVTMSTNTLFSTFFNHSERIPLYATATVQFEEELSLERSMAFLTHRIIEEKQAEEAITEIYKDTNEHSVGTIFAHGNPCLEGLHNWLMTEKMLPLISKAANSFPFAERRQNQVPLEILERRHLTHMEERICILERAKASRNPHRRKMAIIPIQVGISHLFSANELRTHYISFYQEDAGKVSLRIPYSLIGKKSINEFKVKAPDGSTISLLAYLQTYVGLPEDASYTLDNSPIEGEGSLYEIQAGYKAIRHKIQLTEEMTDERVDKEIRNAYSQ